MCGAHMSLMSMDQGALKTEKSVFFDVICDVFVGLIDNA